HRPPLHRSGGRSAPSRRTPVAGGQPAPAVRAGARCQLRQHAPGRAARWLQGGRGGEGRPPGARAAMKLLRMLANLGYGSRRDVTAMWRAGRITEAVGEILYPVDTPAHDDVRVDGEPLDPPQGLLLMLHKPVGYTCSTKDRGRLVYDLLPPRFARRSPV